MSKTETPTILKTNKIVCFLKTYNNESKIQCARHPDYVKSSKFNPKFSYERRNYEALMLMMEIFDLKKNFNGK